MTTFVERFGTAKEWSTECVLCKGTQFLDQVEISITMFREITDKRCPCWLCYTAMQRLWEQSFPKAHIQMSWDSSYPVILKDEKLRSLWEQRHPDSWAWQFPEDDENAVRFWVDNPNEVDLKGLSLVLYGPKGTGKTSLATVLSKEYTKRKGVDPTGFKSDFVPKFLVCDELYEQLASRDWKGRENVQQAMHSSLLVLDDLRLNYTGYVQVEYSERLHSFLQHRAGNNLPTIITVNKIAQTQDFKDNAVTEFLGLTQSEIPKRFGKYRFVELSNQPLRPEPEWNC